MPKPDEFAYIRNHYGIAAFKGMRCFCGVAGAGVYNVVGASGPHLKIKREDSRTAIVHPLDIVPEFEVCQKFEDMLEALEGGQ